MVDGKIEELKMARAKFFTDLNSLAIATTDLERQNATWKFFRSVYEFFRLRRLLPNETRTEENEDQFKRKFEPGIIAFATEMKGATSIPRAANLYIAKLYLSALVFICNDMLPVYEKRQGSSASSDLQQAISEIERQQNFLKNRMDDWEYEMDFYNPNKWEMTCLEGIPSSHQWWNKELGITGDKESERDSDSDWTT